MNPIPLCGLTALLLISGSAAACSFVASAGQIRGAHLKAALAHIRQQHPTLLADDLQLARAFSTSECASPPLGGRSSRAAMPLAGRHAFG
jgi:hypothetical protein